MNPWKGLAGLPRSIWMLSLSTLVNRLGTMAMFFLTLYLVQGRGWRETDAATAMFIYGLGAVAAGPFSGRLSDRLGHQRVLFWSLLTSGLGVLAIPFATSKTVLLPLIGLWSALTQAFWPASMALVSDMTSPEQRKQAFVLHRLAGNLGLSVGPALGGFIAKHSYPALFWIDGITTLMGALVLALGVRYTPAHAHTHHGPSVTGWLNRRLLLLLLAMMPVVMVFTQIHGTLPLWISRDLAHGPDAFGLVFTFNTLIILLAEVWLNVRLAGWTHGHQLGLGALLIALGFGLTGFTKPVPFLVGTIFLWTLGEMIFMPASGDAIAALAPPDRRGEYMGLYSWAWTLALTLGPWLGLLVYAKASPHILWAGCGAAGLLSAVAMWRFKATTQ